MIHYKQELQFTKDISAPIVSRTEDTKVIILLCTMCKSRDICSEWGCVSYISQNLHHIGSSSSCSELQSLFRALYKCRNVHFPHCCEYLVMTECNGDNYSIGSS